MVVERRCLGPLSSPKEIYGTSERVHTCALESVSLKGNFVSWQLLSPHPSDLNTGTLPFAYPSRLILEMAENS